MPVIAGIGTAGNIEIPVAELNGIAANGIVHQIKIGGYILAAFKNTYLRILAVFIMVFNMLAVPILDARYAKKPKTTRRQMIPPGILSKNFRIENFILCG